MSVASWQGQEIFLFSKPSDQLLGLKIFLTRGVKLTTYVFIAEVKNGRSCCPTLLHTFVSCRGTAVFALNFTVSF
jgi:hypothetical protein